MKTEKYGKNKKTARLLRAEQFDIVLKRVTLRSGKQPRARSNMHQGYHLLYHCNLR